MRACAIIPAAATQPPAPLQPVRRGGALCNPPGGMQAPPLPTLSSALSLPVAPAAATRFLPPCNLCVGEVPSATHRAGCRLRLYPLSLPPSHCLLHLQLLHSFCPLATCVQGRCPLQPTQGITCGTRDTHFVLPVTSFHTFFNLVTAKCCHVCFTASCPLATCAQGKCPLQPTWGATGGTGHMRLCRTPTLPT